MIASAAQTVLSYLQTLVWPAVTTGLVLFFVTRFRKNIAGLLDRITEARGPGGTALVAAAPPSQDVGLADESGAAFDLEEVQVIVETYEAQLREAQQTHEQNVEWLTGELATARLELDFERIYRVIFGSQIAALSALRNMHPSSAPRGSIEPIFGTAKTGVVPWVPGSWLLPEGWTFEQWITFLLRPGLANQSLVEQLGDGTYRITPKGMAFLGYTEAHQLPPKPF